MANVLEELVNIAVSIRDESCAKVEPPLGPLPDPLPLNVTGVPKLVLTAEECEITETEPITLVEKIKEGKYTALQVTKAFLRRAALAQKLLNCVTELLWDRAVARAAELDEIFTKTGKTVGPFHGLPISSKEHFSVKDRYVNASFVAWAENKVQKDAHVIEVMESLGAVLFVRSTQPQTIMHVETETILYGRTVNPYNRNLSSGGSTGGEGALLGLNATPLGMGTDIGGSARWPAASNGRYGMRPTAGRIPMLGLVGPNAGAESISGAIGPLSQSRKTMEYFFKYIIGSKPWITEPALLPVPWRDEPLSGKVKIGIMWSDNVVNPLPPVKRALDIVVEALKKGVPGWDIELVDWEPLEHAEAWKLTSELYYPDGGERVAALLASVGEEQLPLTKWIMSENPYVKKQDIHSLWNLNVRRDAYRLKHSDHWNKTGEKDGHPVDIILCPVAPNVACLHGTAKYWSYTSHWNLVDSPGAVFPVTVVDQEKDVLEKGYTPLNEQDKFFHDIYAPEKYLDAPVDLQIVSRRFNDDVVLQAMKIVEIALGRDS
ncbi:amidase signature domain-containing protein [Lipomyces oligophaga]|uniref:amidase signature domain-containing protein n=1 Tax=Lipomyces oligophaga TaxID=45792 RepID=UPI0034CF4BEF